MLLFDTDYMLDPESHATKVEGLNNEAVSPLLLA